MYANQRIIFTADVDQAAQLRQAAERIACEFLIKPVKQGDLFDVLTKKLVGETGPTALPAARPALNPSASLDQADGVDARRPLRVLIAEDNAVNQMITIAMLKKYGHAALAVANGREAVYAWQAEHFDLILMDCQMPEMDGFEATVAIRAAELGSNRHIPIIALTANALKDDRLRCLAYGMDAYISKPIRADALAAAMERAMHPVSKFEIVA